MTKFIQAFIYGANISIYDANNQKDITYLNNQAYAGRNLNNPYSSPTDGIFYFIMHENPSPPVAVKTSHCFFAPLLVSFIVTSPTRGAAPTCVCVHSQV